MARLPRRDPLPDPIVRDAFAAIEGGERCRDSRDLPLVVVEIRGDRFRREERTRASRGARHFFEALLQRVSNAHGDGCGARRFHNVLHCITGGVTRHEGSLWRISHSTKIGKREGEFWKRDGFRDHADWMRRASRISTGERRAERGVERSFAGWFGSADAGWTVQKTDDMLECLI
jgi:hypothetical protein